MRPLTLTMTAFGPYKSKEIIDFNQLDGNNLFVISGNTGSGKTTIFDGISFALYGSASGQDRESNLMLRSHFADDDVHTSVELLFELNKRTYRLLRQLGHIKQGNKTKTGDNYEFYEVVQDKEVPVVDRQIVSEIDRKVEELIGLTQEQFKQIVMLPQGEFRKLLTSQTENKEEILRRLFKTDSYQQMNEQLRVQKELLENEFSKLEQLRDHYIQTIHGTLQEREESLLFHVLNEEHYNVNQVLAALDKEVDYYEERIITDEQDRDRSNENYSKKQKAFHEAQVINNQFTQLNEKEAQYANLLEHQTQIKQKTKQLERAECVNELEPLEHKLKESQAIEARRKVAVRDAKDHLLHVEKQVELAKKAYDEEEKNESKRNNTLKMYNSLQDLLPLVEEIEKNKRTLDHLEVNVKEAEKKIEFVTKERTEKKLLSEKLQRTITDYETSEGQYMEKHTALIEMRDKYSALESYDNLLKNQQTLDKACSEKEQQRENANKAYRKREEEWLNDQAVILATNLYPGDICPVCGSDEHPKKANHTVEGITKEELDHLKREYDKKDDIYQSARVEKSANYAQLKEAKQAVVNYNVADDHVQSMMDDLMVQGKKLRADVKEIEDKAKQLKKLRIDYNKIENELKLLDVKHDKVDQSRQAEKNNFIAEKAVYDDRLKKIPEEFRVLTNLQQKITELKIQSDQLERAWVAAQQNVQQAKRNETKAVAQLSFVEKELTEATTQRVSAQDRFTEEIKKAGFGSIEMYDEAKLTKDIQNKLKSDIDTFNKDMVIITEQINELKEVLYKKEHIDLGEMEAELNKLKDRYERALNRLTETRRHTHAATKLRENITREHENVKEYEKKLVTVTDLYNVMRGQNERKISFERYLQIGYLEQIIDAANERLNDISNGQFLLIRSERQETHGRQSGLALDVYDAYTGQARDVKSLSGGEKFNTSLCLALGMSDVVQSFQGGVSIETMFIDEGFGSLDEESLNKAIDTLIDLQQSGRMIGVVSHVEQLKAIFPAILQVTKEREGYSKTEFYVK